MILRSLVLIVANFTIVAVVSAADPCPAIDVTTFWEYFIADLDGTGEKRWRAEVPLPEEEYGEYYVGQLFNQYGQPIGECDCPDEHKDCKPQSYTHVHYAQTYPLTIEVNMEEFEITEEMALAFWDDEYPSADGYDRDEGPMDVSQNCHGHATGYGTYITGGTFGMFQIINTNKCWVLTQQQAGNATIALSSNYAHGIRIDDWQTCGSGHQQIQKPSETSEKYRNSPVYTRDIGCSDFTFKQEFGDVYSYGEGYIPRFTLGNWGYFAPNE